MADLDRITTAIRRALDRHDLEQAAALRSLETAVSHYRRRSMEADRDLRNAITAVTLDPDGGTP